MISDEIMLKVENVSKVYKLGEIGGTTLRDELQRMWAKLRKKEDPTKKLERKTITKAKSLKPLIMFLSKSKKVNVLVLLAIMVQVNQPF